jgi:hypothetical protein
VTEEKKANHRTPIVRIAGFVPIEGADKIHQVIVEGYEAFSFVSQKTTFNVGDYAVFIQPDSIVPVTETFRFIWGEYDKQTWEGYNVTVTPIPESKLRITVRRFKKVWSEGLLLPLRDFLELDNQEKVTRVGEDVSDLLGITHYDADVVAGTPEAPGYEFAPKRKKKYPKTLKGWFYYGLHLLHVRRQEKFLVNTSGLSLPVYDVENFKNYSRTFVDGEIVHVTEKIHGSGARFVAVDGVLYAGSRKQWVNTKGTSYPAAALEANPWIETWCLRNEGYALYGEVTPRQKGFNYGEGTKFWLFDVRNPAGQWLDADDILYLTFPQSIDMVPLLYHGGYDKALIDILVDGSTTVKGASHIREGIVIKTTKTDYRRGVGRAQLKLVSNAFLDKDGKLAKE